jgi:quercetin dioxygenase-like cupin family protein
MAKLQVESGRFYGVIVNQWRVGTLSFSESVYPPGTEVKRHLHPHPYFSILLRGAYRETYTGGVRECEPATAVLHPPGEAHSDQFLNAGGRVFRFEIVDGEADSFLVNQIYATAELRNGRVRCLAARLYRESRSPDCFSPITAEALALEIIGEATRDSLTTERSGTPSWLRRAIADR